MEDHSYTKSGMELSYEENQAIYKIFEADKSPAIKIFPVIFLYGYICFASCQWSQGISMFNVKTLFAQK